MSKGNKNISQFPKQNSQPKPAVTPAPVTPPTPPLEIMNDIMTFDPRTLATPVYTKLNKLRQGKAEDKLRKQKSMAQKLYTYLSTWGLMRLKAEETILKDGRGDPVQAFFECLSEISGIQNLDLESLKGMNVDEYLGLTGLGLEIAREFSFWVSAIYHDVKGEDS